MGFNKDQLDGLAKNFDNIGIAFVGALIVGGLVDSKLTVLNSAFIGLAAVTTFTIAILLRVNK